MRTLFAVIGMVFSLGMASASAGEVTSVGGTVLSSNGQPVTSGGAIIESEHEDRSRDTGGRGRSDKDNEHEGDY